MKPFLALISTGLQLGVIYAAVLLGQRPAAAAVTFSVTPTAVSNQYTGAITLQIGGVTNGETVAVDKYLDANTNGVIDATDWLVQSFRLTDGQAKVIGVATNINVPFDTTPPDGAITSQVSFVTGGLGQQLVGKYIYRLSSPTGRFPSTNISFTVTNSAFAQSVSGRVVCNGTNVPYAGVMLFAPPTSGDSGMSPVAGTVADSSGGYSLKVPTGTFMLWGLGTNYVADLTASPVLTFGSGTTITTNVNLMPATRTISGLFAHAGDATKVLPGIFAHFQSTNRQFIAIGFTDTNGNFSAGVTATLWKMGADSQSLALQNRVELQSNVTVDATAGSVTGVTNAFPGGSALFYGTVKDAQNHPLVGLEVDGWDNNNQYQPEGRTDQNGNYAIAAIGGSGTDWQVQPYSGQYGFTNYIFAQVNTNISDGQAIRLDFVGIIATNSITGYVKDAITSNGIAGVGVNASTTINGSYYSQYGRTDSNGYYTCSVATGTWQVAVNCGFCSDCLGSFGYQCPTNFYQDVTISNNNAVVNFTAPPCGPLQLVTGSPLPDGQVGTYYSQIIEATGCNQPFNWSPSPGSPPLPGWMSYQLVNNSTAVEIYGTPDTAATTNFSARVTDSVGTNVDKSFSLTIHPSCSLYVTTSSLPTGNEGQSYTQQLYAACGQPPYYWSIPNYSASLPPSLSLGTNGVLTGLLTTNGTFYFWARVTDSQAATADQSLSLTINPPCPLQVTSTSLPNGTNGVYYSQQLTASCGVAPYTWSLTPTAAGPPSNLVLAANGVLSGTPVTNGTFNFYARVTDAVLATADQSLWLTLSPPPLLITTAALSNGMTTIYYSQPLAAAGGVQPWTWSLALGSQNPPPGLSILPGGTLAGTPTTTGTYYFVVRVTDASATIKDRPLSQTIYLRPLIQSLTPTGGAITLTWCAMTGQPYQVQYRTDFISTNWNNLGGVITGSVATATTFHSISTNKQRFYRVRSWF